jgi:hypothetical protein
MGDSEKKLPNVSIRLFLKRDPDYRARRNEMLAVFGHEIFGVRADRSEKAGAFL